jgi:hypothetical protein
MKIIHLQIIYLILNETLSMKIKFDPPKIFEQNRSNSSVFISFSAITLVFTISCTPKKSFVNRPKIINAEYLTEGKIIFTNSCGKCHDLPNADDHSRTDWVGIMNSMAPQAKLSEAQHDMVYDYIVSLKK